MYRWENEVVHFINLKGELGICNDEVKSEIKTYASDINNLKA